MATPCLDKNMPLSFNSADSAKMNFNPSEVNRGTASEEFTDYTIENGCIDLLDLNWYKDERYFKLTEGLTEGNEFTLADFFSENEIPSMENYASDVKLSFYARPIIKFS